MTDETADKITCVLLALEYNQRLGKAPLRGDAALTPQYLADLSIAIGLPVSATTWRQIESDAIAKIRLSDTALTALTFLNKQPKPTA